MFPKGYKPTKEHRQNISNGLKGNTNTKGKHLKMPVGFGKGKKNSMYGKHHTEETKKKQSEANKGNDNWAKGLTKEVDNRLKVAGKKISKALKGKKFSKTHCDNLSKALTGRKMPDEQRAYMKALWLNPMYVQKQMIARHVQPNKIETFLNTFLQTILPNEYRFVGDGQLILGGKCPDFMNVNGKKKLIELFGDYWHGEERTGKTNKEVENEKVNHFKKFSFITLIIWQNELKNLKKLKIKIIDFNKS